MKTIFERAVSMLTRRKRLSFGRALHEVMQANDELLGESNEDCAERIPRAPATNGLGS